jgi:LPS-assembly protein
VRAERLALDELTQTVTADGPVRVSRSGHVFDGQSLRLRIDTFEGFFLRPTYRFLSGGQGQAERFDFQGDQRMIATAAHLHHLRARQRGQLEAGLGVHRRALRLRL